MLEHVRFTFTLDVVTDLHVGDGGGTRLTTIRPGFRTRVETETAGDENPDPLVATVARAADGLPVIPATSLKGALRKAYLRVHGADAAKALFGTIKGEDTGGMGRFAIYAGRLDPSAKLETSGLPYWSSENRTYISTHVAINRTYGTADTGKLFHVECVPIGSRFRFDGIWFGGLVEAKTGLEALLAPLCGGEGLSLGSGGRLGAGALRMVENALALHHTAFDPKSGEVVTRANADKVSLKADAKNKAPVTLALSCPGPFASVDPSRAPGANEPGNRIKALKRADDLPIINMESLAGALRSKAAWLAATHGLGGDDRFRKPSGWQHPSELTAVERLFGVTGWRGRLTMTLSKPVAAARAVSELTSIGIDRFSGAVLDSTLFSHEVFTDVSFAVALRLERSDVVGDRSAADDLALLKLLMDDLAVDGLRLGHATNRGFGWFDIAVSGAFTEEHKA